MGLKEYRCNVYVVKGNKIIKKDYTIFIRSGKKSFKKHKPLLRRLFDE